LAIRDRLGELWQAHRFTVVLIVSIAIFATLIRPFGAGVGAGWSTFLYWLFMTAYGIGIGCTTAELLFRRVSAPALVQIAVMSLIVSVGIFPVVLGLQYLYGDPVALSKWPGVFVIVLVISTAVTSICWMAYALKEKSEVAAVAALATTATFASARHMIDEKLPLKLRGAPLLAISSEDHYCRVYTERGDALILMRLADAVAALTAEDGLQTHRSWWVARSGLAGSERRDGRIRLKLVNGIEAPVSRSFAASVRKAGWV
jgi:hypothetical protein